MTESNTTDFITIYVNEFTEASSKIFYEQFKQATNEKKQNIVPVIIDSYGGSVDSALFMNDIIRESNVIVPTVAIGKAMSCGIFLLAAGTPGYRYCSPNCRLMLHSIAAMTLGKVDDINTDVEEFKRLQKLFFSIMSKNCSQKTDYFIKLIHDKMDKDFFMTSKEVLKHRIIDKVGIPNFVQQEKDKSITLNIEE